jgi:hypothetical protein
MDWQSTSSGTKPSCCKGLDRERWFIIHNPATVAALIYHNIYQIIELYNSNLLRNPLEGSSHDIFCANFSVGVVVSFPRLV